MKIILLLIFLLIKIVANEFVQSNTCKGCHPLIYSEFYNSSHRKASIFENNIHKAMWDIHPNKQQEKYTCAKCHTPTDTKLLDNLSKNEKALPQNNNIQTQEAISCVYCHKIENISLDTQSNKNILSSNNKTFYAANENNREESNKEFKDEVKFLGIVKGKSGSPFHKIDYTNNNFYDGNICMGCHSHLQNDLNFDLCRIDEIKSSNKQNCISCHMPKISGTATSIKITKEHRFHGFSHNFNNEDLLSKYLKIDFITQKDGFDISLENEAPHNLFLQPLRIALLKTNILRDEKNLPLETKTFARTIGKNGQNSSPWLANSEVVNTMLKANEKRTIHYDFKLQKGDKIEIIFGYYLVNPKMLEKLNLQNDERSKNFNILINKYFDVK